MKKNLFSSALLLGLLMLISTAFAQEKKPRPSTKLLDEKYGFRDVKFEADTASLSDLAYTRTEKPFRIFERTGDSKQIGGAEVEDISYGFYKGRLAVIIITTKGSANTSALREAFSAQYGSGYKSNPYIDEYTWFGQKVNMSIKQNSITHDGTLFMFSRAVFAEKKKDEEAAAAKGGADL